MIMQHQKIIYLLENTPNQMSRFRIKYWIGINDDSRGKCTLTVKLNLNP